MAGISDIIEEFLLSTLADDDKMIISRNGLAEHFSCAPSQINYVLSTRFSPDRGYVVQSKRGGSGYITLIKLTSGKDEYLKELISELQDEKLSQSKMNSILTKLLRDEIITEREQRIISAALSDKSFLAGSSIKEANRKAIFKNILLQLLAEEVGEIEED